MEGQRTLKSPLRNAAGKPALTVAVEKSQKLKGRQSLTDSTQWVIKPDAFAAIVDQKLFDRAQAAIHKRLARRADEELLHKLRRLLSAKGELSADIINGRIPKYYFQDIPAEVMDEIMRDMYASRPDMDEEAIDHWLNCHNAPATIPAWYDRAEEFVTTR